ncbi:protein-export chaperone SecB [Clostridium baratii]|uniref:protein-export chaperone SecB n=1 Tax=Clostridium baratii TaxID=1561 RepID=UPI0030D592E8
MRNFSTLQFENYIVENVEFKVNLDYSGSDKEIEIDLDNNYKLEGDNFCSILELEIFPKAEENDYPFNMKIKMIGLFKVDSFEKEAVKNSYIERNSIAILFPYLRAIVSTYTANSNIGTTILPPINVIKYLEDKKKNKETV